MVFSFFGAAAPNGYLVGAVFASIFAQLAWWPWAFFAMGIACFVLVLAGLYIIPRAPGPVFEDKSISMMSRIDIPGAVTGVIGLVLINFSWNQAPIVGWSTPYVYVILIVGFLFMAAFAFVESRSQFPLVPFQYMNSNFGFVLGCMSLGWATFGIWLMYMVQIMQTLRGASPLLTTAWMSPLPVSGVCAALTTGYVLRKIPASSVMIVAMLAFAIGITMIGTMPIDQIYWIQTFIGFIVMPWGM